MAVRRLFVSGESKLQVFVNANDKLFIGISPVDSNSIGSVSVLCLEDAELLQEEINNCIREMRVNINK